MPAKKNVKIMQSSTSVHFLSKTSPLESCSGVAFFESAYIHNVFDLYCLSFVLFLSLIHI